MIYDFIIIGAGPSGITAAIYAARKKMNLLIITKDIGGQAAISGDIENYTGYQFISGPELTAKFEEHLRKYQFTVKENEEVRKIRKDGESIFIETDKSVYQAKTALIASGKKSKSLSIAGEKEFKNKGVTYCATCDAPLFTDKVVAVIGGGNSALDAVLQLINIARQVYLINMTAELKADEILCQKAKISPKLSILNNTQVSAILGQKFVNAIRIRNNSLPEKEELLSVEGVFVEIGLIPNSEFTEGIEKNQRGEIKVNSYNQTNIPGIFAAGDVTDVPEKQIIIAAGEGSKAALSAFRYLAHSKN